MRAFTLTRCFSLLLLLCAAVAVGLLIRQHEIQQIESLVEDRNVIMTQVFRHLRVGDGPALLEKEAVAGLLRDANIVRLKLYNGQGKVVFSSDPRQIGDDGATYPGFIAARQGQVNSELRHHDYFSRGEGELAAADLVSSYVPIAENGQVIGVFELYQEVTPLLQWVEAARWQTLSVVFALFGLLCLLQLLIIRHAEKTVRAQERRFAVANHALEQRMMERTNELQQSEQRIRELLDEQRLIFNNAHVGILLLKNRQILKSNQRIADMFGYAKPEDYEGKSTEIFYCSHEEFINVGKYGYSQLAEKGYADFEVEMRHKDGHDLWVIQSGRPLDPAAVLDSPSIWVYTDITERKEAEAELSIAAAAFASQEAMLVTDLDGVILRVNQAFTECTGYRAEELIGKTPRLLRSNRHDQAFYAELWETLLRTGFWQGEIWDRRKNGEVYPKWLTISAVRGRDGVVTHYVGSHTDITERKLSEEKIRLLAFFDPLTGLPNRTLLLDRLKQAMSSSERTRSHGALLFLDLDHFKTLNDTLGHDQGDRLLMLVAGILTSHVRQVDTVARLGGDEFVILLQALDADPLAAAGHVEATCRKLLAAIKQDYHLASSEFHSSASVGATLFLGEKTSIEELLKQADLAMYKSKEAGRNAFTFFDPSMEASVLARTQIEADLRRAIQEQQFLLHYQPQIDGKSKQLIGAEALLRWSHPVRGMIPPCEFIHHAEETGLIVPLGYWVLETACQQLARWAGQPAMAQLTLAVNVSVQQFRQADFVEAVIARIEQSGANPQRLKLELTESLFVDNVEDIISKMSALKKIGVGFSLDDFGTGYSSLAYLSRLPLDQLKIDRSFVMDMEMSDNNVAICAATISLSHSLRLKVVAEGVETEAQHYFLTTVHHCDFLQGFHFGQPLPLQEFEARAGQL